MSDPDATPSVQKLLFWRNDDEPAPVALDLRFPAVKMGTEIKGPDIGLEGGPYCVVNLNIRREAGETNWLGVELELVT